MYFFEFETSDLSCIKNDFNNKTDEKLNEIIKIITEKDKDNETITEGVYGRMPIKDKLNNIIYKLNEIIIKPDNIINEFKIDKPDYIIFGLQKIVDEIERIISNNESIIKPDEIEKIIESEII
jgi:hypothetical protein